MRFLQADRVYPVTSGPIPDGMLVLEDEGTIREVIDPGRHPEMAAQLKESGRLESMKGWLVPGFINSHCHLELSWMKGRIAPGGGLPRFIGQLVRLPAPSVQEIRQAMQAAEAEMLHNGIVAVGDISNTADSLEIKKAGRLQYHTFVETYDLQPERAKAKFDEANFLAGLFRKSGLRASVVPHAPYTVSTDLMRLINNAAVEDDSLLSIHNQETASEDAFFIDASGELSDFMNAAGREPSGRSSFLTVAGILKDRHRILLVHNTYTGRDDFRIVERAAGRYWWCLCPNANRFIEQRLPDVPMFFEDGRHTVIGTDSLASNDGLSVLDEMKSIADAFPGIGFEQLLSAATINAARFFGWADQLGSMEKGKRPGLNLLTGVNKEDGSVLTGSSKVTRLC